MSSGRGTLLLSPLRVPPLKRHHSSLLNGINSSFEDRSNDFLCPICFEMIDEAHITPCGHTFCYDCIQKSLEKDTRCPKCAFIVQGIKSTVPNLLLNELISKYKSYYTDGVGGGGIDENSGKSGKSSGTQLHSIISSESGNLTLPDVNRMLEILQQRKQRLEAESYGMQNRLLYEFLKNLLKLKEKQLSELTKELCVIKRDINEVESLLMGQNDTNNVKYWMEIADKDGNEEQMKKEAVVPEGRENMEVIESFSSVPKNIQQTSFSTRNQIIQTHFDDFVQSYFGFRAKEITFGKSGGGGGGGESRQSVVTDSFSNNGLDVFRENLIKFSRFSKLRPLATLNYSNDMFNNSTIVSSIEFDKDCEFFAIAGVTKKIKIYEYNTVIQDVVDIHYPCLEMASSSKISCISWNSYYKCILASSDYEGTVTIWDASVGVKSKIFEEHEKRCWSVDFNRIDTRLIASGSDDARVKLWSLNMNHSVASLEAKANVCCVKFNPKSSCHIAFGSADHCVHYYDLRNMKKPLQLFKGHKKAVSYVKFLNKDDLVSASTDSQLKLWNVNTSYCSRSYLGHINEKNFVGLGTDGDYIACGSENNSLYIYYKGLSKPLFNYKFDAVHSVLEKEQKTDDDVNEFVSAVCWRQISNVVVAANSQGIIKILELV